MDNTQDVEGLTLSFHSTIRSDSCLGPSILPCTRATAIQPQSVPTNRIATVYTNLNLHIEHCVRVNLQAQRSLHVPRKPLLVALLHRRPLLLEGRFVDMFQQVLKCAYQ